MQKEKGRRCKEEERQKCETNEKRERERGVMKNEEGLSEKVR